MASKSFLKTFNYLSWFLIECKIIYYQEDNFSRKFLSTMEVDDATYDKLERKYKRMAKLAKVPNTIQNMVGIDMSKPSSQLALSRLKRIDRQIRKKKFTGCPMRYRLGVTQGASDDQR